LVVRHSTSLRAIDKEESHEHADLFGKGRGVIAIRYQDDERLKGDYTLYYQVDRVYP
jgi:hypothetical protein